MPHSKLWGTLLKGEVMGKGGVILRMGQPPLFFSSIFLPTWGGLRVSGRDIKQE
jgi:hypothetical protein